MFYSQGSATPDSIMMLGIIASEVGEVNGKEENEICD
jgi:hypothetical protein